MANTKAEASAKHNIVKRHVMEALNRAADACHIFAKHRLQELAQRAEAVDTSWRGLHELKPSRFAAASRLVEILYERIDALNKLIDADKEAREATVDISKARKSLLSMYMLGSMLDNTEGT